MPLRLQKKKKTPQKPQTQETHKIIKIIRFNISRLSTSFFFIFAINQVCHNEKLWSRAFWRLSVKPSKPFRLVHHLSYLEHREIKGNRRKQLTCHVCLIYPFPILPWFLPSYFTDIYHQPFIINCCRNCKGVFHCRSHPPSVVLFYFTWFLDAW